MKKIFFILLMAVLTTSAFAQWTLIGGGNQGPELRCPYFVNGKTGWMVGGVAGTSAAVFKTTNAGASWSVQTATFNGVVRAIHCIDANTCIACGEGGNIMKTTNGGATWISKPSGTSNLLRSIYFTNSTTGYAAGSAGTIIKTTDAGETWSPLSSDITQDLINIRFGSENVGFAVSSTSVFSNGIILKTTNGGESWSQVYTNNQGLLALAVVNDKTIFAGGGDLTGLPDTHAYIVRSTDGGTTWQEVFSGVSFRSLRGGEFNTDLEGWFVGDAGYIIGTKDGGETWNAKTKKNTYLGINFANADTGYACGIAGLRIRYIDPLRTGEDELPSFNVYPNPMVTGATISLTSDATENSRLIISDLQGRTIRTIDISGSNNVTVYRDQMASGVYIIDLISNNRLIERQKLVVQ